jgi:hypothetical protein
MLVKGDVASQSDVARMFDEVESTLAPIYGLVNNAGITGKLGPFLKNGCRCNRKNILGQRIWHDALLSGGFDTIPEIEYCRSDCERLLHRLHYWSAGLPGSPAVAWMSVFMLLVNKSPFKRITAVIHLTMDTVYRKVDFVRRQCSLFAGDREQLLLKMKLPTRYIAVDRQVFVVNWKLRKDRRNVNLLAVASADLETGFVFGMRLNYDAMTTRILFRKT